MSESELREPGYKIIKDTTMNYSGHQQMFLLTVEDDGFIYFEVHTRTKRLAKKKTQDVHEAERLQILLEQRLRGYTFLDDAELCIQYCLSFTTIHECLFAIRVRDRIIKYESLHKILSYYKCRYRIDFSEPVFADENWAVSIYVFLPGRESHMGIFRGRFLQQDFVFFFSE